MQFYNWYRITVILDFNKLKFYIQNDKIREHKLIFKRQILELNKGSLGFATNGNSNFYLNGISIQKNDINKKSEFKDNKRSWQGLLKQLSPKERKIFCRELFDNSSDEVQRCMEIRFYCQIKCDNIIPREENILNFACFNDCIRTSQGNIGFLSKNKKIFSNILWNPKSHDKCDFKPHGSNFFRMGVIKKATGEYPNIIVEVLYRDYDRNILSALVKFPNKDLLQCGSVLTRRNDCHLPQKKRNKNRKISDI